MTISASRQAPLVAIQDIAYDDFESAVAAAVSEIPGNGVVIGGFIVVDTAWNSVTSDTFILGDDDDDNRYLNAVDMQSTGVTELTITGYKHTTAEDLLATWTGVGTAPTAGAGRLVIEYVVEGRSQSTQG